MCRRRKCSFVFFSSQPPFRPYFSIPSEFFILSFPSVTCKVFHPEYQNFHPLSSSWIALTIVMDWIESYSGSIPWHRQSELCVWFAERNRERRSGRLLRNIYILSSLISSRVSHLSVYHSQGSWFIWWVTFSFQTGIYLLPRRRFMTISFLLSFSPSFTSSVS